MVFLDKVRSLRLDRVPRLTGVIDTLSAKPLDDLEQISKANDR